MPLADWYDTPLYYDIIFDQDTEKETDFLEAVMLKFGKVRRKAPWRVLEPACGSGRLVASLAARGHRVSGFDLNDNMLEYARERLAGKGQEATLWQDRLESFRLPPRQRFDLAHCLVSTFKYIPEQAGAEAHLQRVAASLCQGGLYVLGLHLTDYRDRTEQHERWAGHRDGVKVTCNTHTWPANRRARAESLRTTLRITQQGITRIQETRWSFRTYNAAELRRLLSTAPQLECVATYDFTYNLTSPRNLDDSYADIVLVLRRL